ncbi:heptahelical transmembrane protein ADIPOR1-like [Hibiscus syriacus]|uniref:heptahelical transmembrane protein ADIPOR1-like n=1 Tax=Hibiscus syriacus TaxID=106335 RepID=UPI0019215B52|nr:heptahelical transmembrane protein ADIPOR1-like [Hibiscus syriacus]
MDPTIDSNLVSEPVETEKCKKRVRSPSPSYNLVSFKELPDYMKDNEFILNHYKVNLPLKEALFSIFRWHNETLNVWTHLLGFVLFLGLTLTNLIEVPQVSDLIAFFTRSYL